MQHLDEGTIHAWLDGQLDAEEAARVERHAAECATCEAAVAEARGFAAGASRILGALDHVPAGVVPRATGGPLGGARSSRPLWRVLHFTPARAAAAAILIVAAGTVLVVRHAPNAALSVDTEAGPQALQPHRAAPMMATSPLPAASPPAPTPAPTASREIASRPKPAPRAVTTTAAEARRVEATPERGQVAVVDSTAANKSVVAAAAPVASNAAEAPRALADRAMPSQAKMAAGFGGVVAGAARGGWVGCYEVIADPAAGLPSRLVLDSTRVKSIVAADLRAGAAPIPMYAVRVLSPGLAAAQSSAFVWQESPNGGVRLYTAASSVSPIELHASSAQMLTGTRTIDNRPIQITLQRVADCTVR